jgi:beta-lactamase superfamily II metal-dependent hydrolase
VGRCNECGHPTRKVIGRLRNSGIQIFRTGEKETIIAVSDGEDITFNDINNS